MTEISIRNRATALIHNGKWGRWINRGVWTVTDRGLFALANFGLNVVLARWMSLEAYGTFALAFSVFIIIGSIQTALVSQPVLILGPGRYSGRYETYLGVVVKWQFVVCWIASLGIAVTGAGFIEWGKRDTGIVLLALAVAGPFILLMWLMRKTGYAKLQAKGAAISGAVYMVLILAGTYLLNLLDVLTPATALLMMAAASLPVAIRLGIRQGVKLFEERLSGPFGREVAREHWRYARWTIPAKILADIVTNAFVFALPIWVSLEATGAFRALINLVLPMSFMASSLSVILVPIMVRARVNNTMPEKLLVSLAFFMLTAIGYSAALILFDDEIVRLLYSDKYAAYSNLVWLIALLPIVQAPSNALSAGLFAMEKPRDVFWITLAGASVAMTIGLGATYAFGLAGAIAGNVLSYLTMTVLLALFLRSVLRKERQHPPS
ncbi:MAG: polysaccharide biosynthesis C-terminal domain-containing protein [Hyphomonadaceae bacterium]